MVPMLVGPFRSFIIHCGYLWMTSGVLSHFMFFLPIFQSWPIPSPTKPLNLLVNVRLNHPLLYGKTKGFQFFLTLIDSNQSIYGSSRLDVASYHKHVCVYLQIVHTRQIVSFIEKSMVIQVPKLEVLYHIKPHIWVLTCGSYLRYFAEWPLRN